MFRVMADCYLTRRLAVHQVFDETGKLVFSDKGLMALLTWLVENEHHKFSVEGDDPEHAFLVTLGA